MATDDGGPDFVAEIDGNIGRNVKSARERRGMSQSDLARQVTAVGVPGFHQTTIARIESGQRSLRAAEALAVARVLDVDLESLAESARTSRLRSESASLQQSADAFRKAAGNLVYHRRHAAIKLDDLFPYGPAGEAKEASILQSGVHPDLYWALESRLAKTSPVEILSEVYWHEVRSEVGSRSYFRRPGQGDKSRLEYVFDEMREWLEAKSDGVDQAED